MDSTARPSGASSAAAVPVTTAAPGHPGALPRQAPLGPTALVPSALVPPLQNPQGPEQQLTWALARFQAEVTAIPSSDLGAVAAAAKPALRQGIGWSARLGEQHGRPRLQVTVRHASGAELSSETWASEPSDLVGMTGLMLALLLGIPVAEQPWAVEPRDTESVAAASKPAGEPERKQAQLAPPADLAGPDPQHQPIEPGPAPGSPNADATVDPGLEPLSPDEISDHHRRILALPQGTRRELTTAFREHFLVPRNARSIGDRISQRQHGRFLEHFLTEAQGQLQSQEQGPDQGQDPAPAQDAAPVPPLP